MQCWTRGDIGRRERFWCSAHQDYLRQRCVSAGCALVLLDGLQHLRHLVLEVALAQDDRRLQETHLFLSLPLHRLCLVILLAQRCESPKDARAGLTDI